MQPQLGIWKRFIPSLLDFPVQSYELLNVNNT